MADADLQFVIKAQDQASAVLKSMGSSFTDLAATIKANTAVMQQLQASMSGLIASNTANATAAKGHASALKEVGEAAVKAGEGHKKAAEGAEEHEASLRSLVGVTKEAAEAFASMWAMNELNEKTIGAYAEAEVALKRLQLTTGQTAKGMKELSEAAGEIAGHSLNQTAEQIVAIMGSAAELGVKGVRNLKEFAETISQVSTATGLATGTITSSFDQMLSSAGETSEKVGELGDVFVTLASKTRGGSAGLLQTSSVISTMTAGMNVSSQTALVLGSAIANLGVRARGGAQAVGTIFKTFQNLTEDRGLATELNKVSAALGYTAEGFQKLEREDPSKLIDSLLGKMQAFESKGGRGKDFLKSLGLDGSAEQTLNGLIRDYEKLKQTREDAENAAKNPGEAKKESGELTKGLTGEMNRATVAAKEFGEAIGEAVSPAATAVLRNLADAIEYAKKSFDDLGPVTKAVVGDIIIGVPMLLAGATAFKLLAEVAETGAGAYGRMGGVLGGFLKTLRVVIAGEHELVAAEAEVASMTGEATAAVVAHTEALELAGTAAKTTAAAEAEMGVVAGATAAKVASGGLLGSLKSFMADSAGKGLDASMFVNFMKAEDSVGISTGNMVSKVSQGIFSMANTTLGQMAVMTGSVMAFMGLLDALEKTASQQSDLGKAGVTWGDEWAALTSSKDEFTKRMQAKKDAGQFKPEALPGKPESEEELDAETKTHFHNGKAKEEMGGRGSVPSSEQSAEFEKNAEAANNGTVAVVSLNQVKDLDDYVKAMKELSQTEDSLSGLNESFKGMSDEQRTQLGLTQSLIDGEAKLLQLRRLALDPMQKQTQAFHEQLEVAGAYTAKQRQDAEAEIKVREAREAAINAHQGTDGADRAEKETRDQIAKTNTTTNDTSARHELETMTRTLATSYQLNQADKDRLEIENQIAVLGETHDYTKKQLDNMKQILTLTKQVQEQTAQFASLNPQAKALQDYADALKTLDQRFPQGGPEKDREKTKLDNDTLAARSPVGKLAQDQGDELASMEIVGKYREADVKSLQEIVALKRQGLDIDKETADGIKGNNRALQDLKDAQAEVTQITDSFGTGLAGAIQGALEGQRGAFSKFALSMGTQLTSMAMKDLMKNAEGALAGPGGMLSGLFGNASKGIAGLTGDAAKQAAKTADAAAGTLKDMAIQANNVTIMANNIANGGAPGTPGSGTPSVPGTPGGATPGVQTPLTSDGKLPVSPASFGGSATAPTADGSAPSVTLPSPTAAVDGAAALNGASIAPTVAGAGGIGTISSFGAGLPSLAQGLMGGGSTTTTPGVAQAVSAADTARWKSVFGAEPNAGEAAAINKFGVEKALDIRNNPGEGALTTVQTLGGDAKGIDGKMTNGDYLKSLTPAPTTTTTPGMNPMDMVGQFKGVTGMTIPGMSSGLGNLPPSSALGAAQSTAGGGGLFSGGVGSLPDVVRDKTGYITQGSRFQYMDAAHDFYKGQGFSDKENTAILANQWSEGAFDPRALNKNDVAAGRPGTMEFGRDSHGIGQWNTQRYGQLQKQYDKEWGTHDESKLTDQQMMQSQLKFTTSELKAPDPYRAALEKTDSDELSPGAFGKVYEGFAGNRWDGRDKSGRMIADRYADGAHSAPAGPPKLPMAAQPKNPMDALGQVKGLMGGAGGDKATTASGQPLVFGDSIGDGVRKAGGFDGSTLTGMNPQQVLANLQGKGITNKYGTTGGYTGDLKGQNVQLSSGISNNPADMADVAKQLDFLKSKGANTTLMGTGTRTDLAPLNDQLEKLAKEHGATFGGALDPNRLNADQVHPTPAAFKDMADKLKGGPVARNSGIDMNPTGSIDKAAKQAQDVASQQLQQQMKGLTDVQKTMGATVKDTSQGFQSSFSEVSKSVEGAGQTALGAVPDMGQFGQSISSMVSKLGQSGGGGGLGGLGSLFGGGGGGGLDSVADAFHGGGLVGSSFGTNMGRRVSSSVFKGAPRFHDGLNDDEFPAILQRGERVITQNQEARTARLIGQMSDQAANRGNGNMQQTPAPAQRANTRINMVVNTKDANSFRYSQPQIQAGLAAHVQRTNAKHN